MMRINRKKAIVLAAIPLLTLAGVVIAQSLFFSTSANFTVGSTLSVSYPQSYYNVAPTAGGGKPTGGTACTQSGTSYTCSFPATIFGSDQLSLAMNLYSDKASETPTLVVSGGSFTAFTTSIYSDTYDGQGNLLGGGGVTTMPTITAGQTWFVSITVTISPTAPTGAASISFSVSG
jgi:hypothetical protein